MQQKEQSIQNIGIQDLQRLTPSDDLIKYIEEDLMIVEDMREIPSMNSKITFNVVAVCVSGRLQFEVSGKPTQVEAGQIFICHSHATLSSFMLSPDFECKMMCISDRLLRNILSSQMQLWTKTIYRQTSCILTGVLDENRHFSIYNELRYRWLHPDTPFNREILFSLLRAVLLEVCEQMLQMEQSVKGKIALQRAGSRMEELFHQFLENIARRHIKKLPVAVYADELCISPKYLSTVSRTVSGKAPTEWINEHVIQDVIYYLKNTSLTASQIGIELGFNNASFFAKYVREHLGTSPKEYRKQLKTEQS